MLVVRAIGASKGASNPHRSLLSPVVAAAPVSSLLSPCCRRRSSFFPSAPISSSMGRPPWATPEQTEFLRGYTPNLNKEKEGNGLTAYYDRITMEFLKRWPARPTDEDRGAAADGKDPQSLANTRRKKVRLRFPPSNDWALNTDCQQIHEWYKAFRSKQDQPHQPKGLLDLTGKGGRKPAPLQLHHAYSVRFFRPKDSPLRQEVEDLWNRREEKAVIDQLTPFKSSGDPRDLRLAFHNTVMRWKSSLLTDEERKELQDWIGEKVREKEEEMNQPWKATQGALRTDELSAENEYIQGYVCPCLLRLCHDLIRPYSCIDALPSTIDRALEQIERSTGMKAVILIGGPTPAASGDFSTHW